MKTMYTALCRLRHLVIISILSLSVMSCGGGGGSTSNAGISGTGISTGTVTGFGSVFVNGVKYEVDDIEFSQNFKVDDSAGASQDDLKIGMVVSVRWTSFDDGTTQADFLVYDDSVEGPITSPVTLVPDSTSKKKFDVLGENVIVDASSTSFIDSTSPPTEFDFDSIAEDDVIEVSGFIDGGGNILATLVEKKGSLSASGGAPVAVELRVTVPSPDPAGSFIVGSLTVNYDVSGVTTEFDDIPGGVLTAGLKVEVKGLFDPATNIIQATEIEGEGDDGLGSDDPDLSVSVQGAIAGLDKTNPVNWEFTVSGVSVQLINSAIPQSILDQLVEGLIVEVEGTIASNVLQADQLEIRESEAEYRAIVQSIDIPAQTLTIGYPLPVIGELVMQLDSRSTVIDENNDPISLNDIIEGDDVKISARVIETEHIVIRLKRERGESKSYEITGKVQAFSSPDGPITIEGLVFSLDPGVIFDVSFGVPPDIVDQVVELEDGQDVGVTTVRDGLIDRVSPPG